MNWVNAKDRLPEKGEKVYVYCIGHCYFKFEPDFDECIAQCKLPEGESAWNCAKHKAVPHWTEASCCGYPSHKVEDDDYWISLDDIPKPDERNCLICGKKPIAASCKATHLYFSENNPPHRELK